MPAAAARRAQDDARGPGVQPARPGEPRRAAEHPPRPDLGESVPSKYENPSKFGLNYQWVILGSCAASKKVGLRPWFSLMFHGNTSHSSFVGASVFLNF